MNKTILAAVSLLSLAVSATPALATDLGSGLSITGGATLVSDYRFRGISQTDKRAAVQGTFTISHSSGFYGTVWGSSIADYVESGSNQEIDLIAGYSKTFGSTKLDGGVLYYYYPGSGGINSDFFEPYVDVSQTFGPVTAKVTANYGFKQRGLAINQVSPKLDSLYLAGDLSAAIPKTPVSLTAHVGHTYGPSYLSIGKGYTDYGVGASVTVKSFTLGVQYVDTNRDLYNPFNGRNESKSGVVASIGAAF
ncbi:MAG: TorF family putative porin [Sphingomicrobium sp.]